MSNKDKPLSQQLEENYQLQKQIEQENQILVQKAHEQADPDTILKASRNYSPYQQRKSRDDAKSFVLNPLEVSANEGWKVDRHSISPSMLRSMARTPYVRSIISTRVDQIADFCKPQSDKYSIGWVIEKDGADSDKELSKEDQKKIDYLNEVIDNCGEPNNNINSSSRNWTKDQSFDHFARKWAKDSLELDAGTFEVLENKKGGISEFFTVDGSTIYKSDNYDDETRYSDEERKQLLKDGFYPEHVQVLDGQIVAEYWPWELSYAIRNPSTELDRNFYGYSELNSLIQTVTALMNADSYNANFFKIGSAPQGILQVSGENLDRRALNEFKKQWKSEVSGVQNAHKIPVINSEKASFINTHMSNKDMEFSHYHEFLIRILCVLYKMSPKEVGLKPDSGSGGINSESGEKDKQEIQYSKSKGLKPILKLLEKKINKYVIKRIYPEFRFRFAGLEVDDQDTELDRDTKSVQYIETYNDLRKRKGLEPVDWGDIPLNPTAVQAKQMAMMQGGGGEEMPMPEDEEFKANDNPILDSFENYIKNDLNTSYDV